MVGARKHRQRKERTHTIGRRERESVRWRAPQLTTTWGLVGWAQGKDTIGRRERESSEVEGTAPQLTTAWGYSM